MSSNSPPGTFSGALRTRSSSRKVAVTKVLHVIPSRALVRGGPIEIARNLARNLTHEGVDTHVATTDDNGRGRFDVPFGEPVLHDGVTYWYFPRQTRFYTFSWPLSAWLSRHI